MKYTFLSYPKCSTCKSAKKFLDENNIEYTERHIKENPLSETEIDEILKISGLDIQKLFNTSGIVYREMNLKEKLKDISQKEKIQLLSSDGMLVKRPILYSKSRVLVGFKESQWEEIRNK